MTLTILLGLALVASVVINVTQAIFITNMHSRNEMHARRLMSLMDTGQHVTEHTSVKVRERHHERATE